MILNIHLKLTVFDCINLTKFYFKQSDIDAKLSAIMKRPM